MQYPRINVTGNKHKESQVINQDDLRRLLAYDAQTGLFTWIARSGTAKEGAACVARNQTPEQAKASVDAAQ